MVQRIGGAEADRALVQRFRDETLHLGQFGGGGLLADRSLFAHYRGPHRRMPDQHSEIHVRAPVSQHPHVFGEGLEPPINAGTQRVEVHAFHDREITHDHVAQQRRGRHDAETAIAHHSGSDAERRRRRQGRVPGDLRVVMRVQIDDAGHQREATSIDHLGRIRGDSPYLGDPAVLDRNIGRNRVVPEAINHCAAADHQIVHRRLQLQGPGRAILSADGPRRPCRPCMAAGPFHDRRVPLIGARCSRRRGPGSARPGWPVTATTAASRAPTARLRANRGRGASKPAPARDPDPPPLVTASKTEASSP